MSGTGTRSGAPLGGGNILPGGNAPGGMAAANPTLDQVITFLDWFGHADNDIFDGVSLTEVPANLAACDPTAAMTTLVSLKPTAPLAFLGLFPSSGAPHGLTCLLTFPWDCPRLLGMPSPFDAGLCAFSDRVAGRASPTVVFPDTAFYPHNDATMITIPDDPNGFIDLLNIHGGSLLPLLASGTADAKDVNVSFMTWVPPCCVHLFLGRRFTPHATAVAGVTAVKNDGTWAQAQPLVCWLMALMHPCNATSPTQWVLFATDMTAPVGDGRFTAWHQPCHLLLVLRFPRLDLPLLTSSLRLPPGPPVGVSANPTPFLHGIDWREHRIDPTKSEDHVVASAHTVQPWLFNRPEVGGDINHGVCFKTFVCTVRTEQYNSVSLG